MSLNEQRIRTLHPVVADKARELVRRAAAEGIRVLIAQGLRTIAEQNDLYAQGRTKHGIIVTHARGGESYHNYGLALDYCLLDEHGKAVWVVDAKWRRVAEIGKTLGFKWGGDWSSFKDYPHLEYTFGLSIKDLLAGQRPPETGEEYMIKVEDANKIIGFLSAGWFAIDSKDARDEFKRLANEIRKVSGQQEQ